MFKKIHAKRLLYVGILAVVTGFGVYKAGDIIHADQSLHNYNEAPTYDEATNTIKLPTMEGYKVQLFGSDHKEIIALDGTVNRPLNETQVNLIYKLTSDQDGSVTESRSNAKITIPARTNPVKGASVNQKPDVIPSLREWVGGSGDVTLNDSTRIVVNPMHKEELANVANAFKSDLQALTQKSYAIVYADQPKDHDLYLTLGGEKELGTEGYYLNFGGNDAQGTYAEIKAPTSNGVYYGTMSVLQILKQDEHRNTLPKGISRDYPMYEKRGFMLDVARKYIPIDYLNDLMKQMSYYKLNTLQLHLNDNDIWNPLQMGNELYSAFRLESDVPGLTAKDGHYTKNEFRQLQRDGIAQNINIIPEIDSPGHALALTRAWPDIAVKNAPKYIDVQNPEAIKKVKSLFEEYMGGDDPVFIGPNVNIGTDEYKTGTSQATKEAFREYANELMEYVNSFPGKKVSFWGSLDAESGTTPVTNNALMLGWYRGYADAAKYLYQGYDIITMEDQDVYIVPGGGYYSNQYGRGQYLYENWQPNVIRNGGNDVIALGHPRLKGGFFALWNDHIGNGISVWDISYRMDDNMKSVAQKTWSNTESKKSYKEFKAIADKVGVAPNSEFLYEHKPYAKDEAILDDGESIENQAKNDIVFDEYKNVTTTKGKNGNALTFQGKDSYIKTNQTSLGYNWTTSMWIHPDKDNSQDAVLMEGRTGTLKLKQGKTNKLGFSVENYDHYFDYVVPSDRWTQLTLTGDAYGTSLYVNGVFKERLIDRDLPNYNEQSGAYKRPIYYETLNLPITYIGSKTNAFVGQLDDFKVFNRVLSDREIKDLAGLAIGDTENLALHKTVTASGTEVADKWQPSAVVDGVTSGDSRWSSNYNDTAWLKIDLGEVKTINEIKIIWEKAYGVKYKMQISETGNDGDWKDVYHEEAGTGGTKDIVFAPQKARYVKFVGEKRVAIGGQPYGYSMYEIEVYPPNERNTLLLTYNQVTELLEKGSNYISATLVKEINDVLQKADLIFANMLIGDDEVKAVNDKLVALQTQAKELIDSKTALQDVVLKANALLGKAEDKISAASYKALKAEIDKAVAILETTASSKDDADAQKAILTAVFDKAEAEYLDYSNTINNASTTLKKLEDAYTTYADILDTDTVQQVMQVKTSLADAIANQPIDVVKAEMEKGKTLLSQIDVQVEKRNLALHKTATASSMEVPKFSPDKAVDGDRSSKDSRWSSRPSGDARFKEWFNVDLGSVRPINRVDIFWESAFAKEYKIYVSATGKDDDYTEVKHITDNKGGHSIDTFATVNARYVKFEGIERTTGEWIETYSFYEFEVYHAGNTDTTQLKQELRETIASVQDFDKLDYTVSTWETLQQSILNANQLINEESSSYEALLLAHEQLKSAIANLKVDKTKLIALVNMYKDHEHQYTVSSWSVFKGVLDEAIKVIQDEHVQGTQVSAIRKQLQAASQKLVKRGDAKELADVIKEYETIKANAYTIDSWNAFQYAMQTAKTALANADDASQSDLDQSIASLRKAFEQLKKAEIVKNKEVKDDKTGIIVNGDFHDNVILSTVVLKQHDEIVHGIKDPSILQRYKFESIYDIALYQGNDLYPFAGNAQIKIKVSDALAKKSLTVFFIDKDGTVQEMKSSIKDGYITFTTSHFSMYAIASKKDSSTQQPDMNHQGGDHSTGNTSGDQNSTTNKPSVDTADATNITWYMMVLLVAAGGCMIFKKRSIKNK